MVPDRDGSSGASTNINLNGPHGHASRCGGEAGGTSANAVSAAICSSLHARGGSGDAGLLLGLMGFVTDALAVRAGLSAAWRWRVSSSLTGGLVAGGSSPNETVAGTSSALEGDARRAAGDDGEACRCGGGQSLVARRQEQQQVAYQRLERRRHVGHTRLGTRGLGY